MSNDPVSQMREYIEELREINRTLNHGTQVLHDYIATLKAELHAARKDTVRLDAVERHKWEVFYGDGGAWALFRDETNYEWINAATLREAIDAALDDQNT